MHNQDEEEVDELGPDALADAIFEVAEVFPDDLEQSDFTDSASDKTTSMAS